jgi:hypothetical protein
MRDDRKVANPFHGAGLAAFAAARIIAVSRGSGLVRGYLDSR